MRKAFNFYRSYYEVAKELSEKDRALFLWAILERQFEGKEPILSGMSNFAYLSQKHSIDAQVLGYEFKSKTKLTPTEGGSQGGSQGGAVQEKGKGKVKVEQAIPTLEEFLAYCKEIREIDFKAYEFSLKSKYEAWVDAKWKDGNNKPIKNWKSKIKNTIPYLKPQQVKPSYIPLSGIA